MERSKFFGAMAGGALVIAGLLAWAWLYPPSEADTLTIPHSFSANTLIRASEFNANFSAVEDIVNGKIDTGNLEDLGVATADLADNAVTNAKMANDSVTTTEILDETIASADILDGTIATADILDGTIEDDDLNTLNAPLDGELLAWDASSDQGYWHQIKHAQTLCSIFDASGEGISSSVYYVTIGPVVETAGSFSGNYFTTTESDVRPRTLLFPRATQAFALDVEAGSAPGAGNSVSVDLRQDGVDTSLDCDITDSNTQCSVTVAWPGFTMNGNDDTYWKVDFTSGSVGSPLRMCASFAELPLKL